MADTILPLAEYLSRVEGLDHGTLAAAQPQLAASAESFGAMREHVLRLYSGVEAVHSFEDDNGSIFDCIPVQSQPSLHGRQPAAPPPALPAPELAGSNAATESPADNAESIPAQLERGEMDRYGNERRCPEGYIPMRRVHVEEIAKFADLRRFLQKSPDESIPPRADAPRAPRSAGVPPATTSVTHKYAHAFQSVANLGGHTWLNVWGPAVASNQVSLSQHWYSAGSGSALQTAEVGWQVYPAKYGNSHPCLFIFWTADGYKTTGCYNLDCTAFVQTSSKWTFGGTLSPVSTIGGTQYRLDVDFRLTGGSWWLSLNRSPVGYYPTSIYRGGAMARGAAEIDYGGETIGSTSWPPMGSGQFASSGYGNACFHDNIYYYRMSDVPALPSLTTSQPSPSCYTAKVVAVSRVILYFGGPGGTGC